MLIVVAVIGLLVTIVITTATRIQNQANEQLTKATFALLESALQEYHEYWNDFPDPNGPLYGQLYSTPSSRKILSQISDSLIGDANTPEIYDPWGMVLDYRYVSDEHTFPQLTSAGPDRKFETPADNITNR